ncbi:MAG TPA: flagellar synthesis regulator FleN [Syntrophaceae bacterium]|jgi:flagellar biosynthesis protein FlhG|nr:flagellar synthesis regulator FleN [Syntrophaceae bacterium]
MEAKVDQAAVLRIMNGTNKEVHAMGAKVEQRDKIVGDKKKENIRVIAITSGKGGVGKTHITANLAYILSRMKKKTLIFDADMGLANIDVILGLSPKYNMHHVLLGEKSLLEVMVSGPGGIKILPAASGIQEMAELSKGQKLSLMDELNDLNDSFDFMFIDTAAGITGNVLYFNMAAKEIIVVVSPEPTSLTDAYALIKILYNGHGEKRIMLIVNMVKNSQEAGEVFMKLSKATEHFLDLSVEYLGFIMHDEKVSDAVRQQKIFAEIYPTSPASKCLSSIARKICRDKPEKYNLGSMKFFSRAIIGADHG